MARGVSIDRLFTEVKITNCYSALPQRPGCSARNHTNRVDCDRSPGAIQFQGAPLKPNRVRHFRVHDRPSADSRLDRSVSPLEGMFTAVRLGIFDGAAIGAAMDRLFDACVGLGLLEKQARRTLTLRSP